MFQSDQSVFAIAELADLRGSHRDAVRLAETEGFSRLLGFIISTPDPRTTGFPLVPNSGDSRHRELSRPPSVQWSALARIAQLSPPIGLGYEGPGAQQDSDQAVACELLR